ncbi:MAG TPA: MAC/perforin domain-containing protein [Thermoanaerobaculia bacterium]
MDVITVNTTTPANESGDRQPIPGSEILGQGVNPCDYRKPVKPVCSVQGTDKEFQLRDKTYYHDKAIRPREEPHGRNTDEAFVTRTDYQKSVNRTVGIEGKYGAFSGRFSLTFDAEYDAFLEKAAALKTDAMTLFALHLEDQTPTAAFKTAADALPAKFEGNEAAFYQFFAKWGAYVVTDVTLGGSMEYALLVETAHFTSKEQLQAQVGAEYGACFKGSGTDKEREEIKNSSTYTKRTLTTTGGKPEIFAGVNLSDPKDWLQQYKDWANSVAGAPAVVLLTLEPISSFVADDRKDATAKALEQYMQSSAVISSSWKQSQISVSGQQVNAPDAAGPSLRVVFIDRVTVERKETRFPAPDRGSSAEALEQYWSRVHDHLASASPQDKVLLLATERWLRDPGYSPSGAAYEALLNHGASDATLKRWQALSVGTIPCPVAGISYVLAGANGEGKGVDALAAGFGTPDVNLEPTAKVVVVLPHADAGRIKVIKDEVPVEKSGNVFYAIQSWSDAPRLFLASDKGTSRLLLQGDDATNPGQCWYKHPVDERYGLAPHVLVNYLTCGAIEGKPGSAESAVTPFGLDLQDDWLWNIRGDEGSANFVLLYYRDANWNLASNMFPSPRAHVRTWDAGDHAMLWQQHRRNP